jgi:hypothetical protein
MPIPYGRRRGILVYKKVDVVVAVSGSGGLGTAVATERRGVKIGHVA